MFENVSQILSLGRVYPVLLALLLVGHGVADSTYTQIAQRRVAICEKACDFKSILLSYTN